jgi:uncharacterized membrane protein YdjX (TVP38/TMEM64 family)
VNPTRRLILLLVAIAALAATAALLPLHRLPEAVAELGPLAPVVGVLVGSALLIALVPPYPRVHGLWSALRPGWGSWWLSRSRSRPPWITFAAGRRWARDFLVRHSGDRLTRLDGWISRQGGALRRGGAVAADRPYGLAGYAYGASGVRCATTSSAPRWRRRRPR